MAQFEKKYYIVTTDEVSAINELTIENTIGIVGVRGVTEDQAVKKTAREEGDFLLDISTIAMTTPEYVEHVKDD